MDVKLFGMIAEKAGTDVIHISASARALDLFLLLGVFYAALCEVSVGVVALHSTIQQLGNRYGSDTVTRA